MLLFHQNALQKNMLIINGLVVASVYRFEARVPMLMSLIPTTWLRPSAENWTFPN